MKNNFFSNELRSFGYAISGINACLRKDRHFRFHFFAVAFVVAAGLFLDLSHVEWCIIITCMAAVIAAEMFNSSIERLTNLISKEHSPLAGEIKDIAAGAVLICALASAVVAGIILTGKL